MFDFLQLVISGVAVGAIYALAALGFALLWQASRTINFAQGECVMIPAFAILIFMQNTSLPLPLAFLASRAVAMLLTGFAFKRLVVDPLIRHGVIPLVIATLGLSIGLKQFVKAGYSTEAHPFPNLKRLFLGGGPQAVASSAPPAGAVGRAGAGASSKLPCPGCR